MTFLLDVNLLMALLWENHEQHPTARGWLRGVSRFASCPVTQLGFARISSHPQLGYGLTPDQAFMALRQFLKDRRHQFVLDDISCSDRALHTDLMLGSKQITDFYLLALARQHGMTLATFDQALLRAFANEPELAFLVV